jgi:hypothetical protein
MRDRITIAEGFPRVIAFSMPLKREAADEIIRIVAEIREAAEPLTKMFRALYFQFFFPRPTKCSEI